MKHEIRELESSEVQEVDPKTIYRWGVVLVASGLTGTAVFVLTQNLARPVDAFLIGWLSAVSFVGGIFMIRYAKYLEYTAYEQKPYSIDEFNSYLELIRNAMEEGYQIKKEGTKIIIENDGEYFMIVPKKGKEQLIEDLWQEYLKLKEEDDRAN